jgi:flagellar biosynthesis protein FlhF
MTWGGIRSHLLAAGAATAAVHRLILDLGQALGETVTWDLKPVPTWGKLVEQMGQLIDFAGALAPEPKRCLKLALVGPTGVGKTTTIAKLAADYHLRQGLRVGLVTMDTFRVGGVDQLQAYAQILDLPVQVVTSPAEMQHAISRFADCDVVLIDSTGRSPRDSARIQHLHSILQAAHVDHLLLTLSATHDLASLRRAAAEFRPLGSDIPTSLILTKVDEVQNLAHLYPMLTDLQIPWRYWTNGQNVPEDLGVADPDVVTWFLDEVAAPLSAGVSSHE